MSARSRAIARTGGGPGPGPAPVPPPEGGGCLAVENWLLTPEGGIVHPGERTAVIADVHLGYEWARGDAGDCIPAHSLEETLGRLERLLARTPVDRLVVAGDLVEPIRPCRRTAADVSRLYHWVRDRGIRLVLLRGNHDGGLNWLIEQGQCALAFDGIGFHDALAVDGWTIVHGHAGLPGRKLVVGHHHPVVRMSGRTFHCFLASPRRIMLPAFSGNAAGLNVISARVSGAGTTASPRCLATSGDELFDFGPLGDLVARLRSDGSGPRRAAQPPS